MASSEQHMASSEQRDWTKLPSDLLGLIAERLPVVDCIRFSTVSTSLASALDLLSSSSRGRGRCLYPPKGPQCPWLILPGDEGELSDNCIFFSLSYNKSYKIDSLPGLCCTGWKGCTEGWLVIQDKSQIRLLNPLTRAQIQLPSIATSTDISLIDGEYYIACAKEYHPPEQFFRSFVRKVILSSSPTTTTATVYGSYTVVAIIGAFNYLTFTKAGDEKWTIYMEIVDVEDVIYHNGKFYCLDCLSRVHALDLTGPSPKKKIIFDKFELPRTSPSIGYRMKYLVESSGHLLQVWRDIAYEETGNGYYTYNAIVLKFDLNGAKWTPLSNLDDRCLFLGNSRSMSLSHRDIPGLMHNCIHFTDNYWDCYHDKSCKRDIGVFNLEDGSFKPYQACDSRKRWPAVMWFTPNVL